jgi:hypothetical protein
MEYKFNGTEGKPIPQETAKQWSENYQKKNPGETKSHFFGRDIIEKILAEDGCMGIRIYYALDDNGQKQLLLVGADSEGNNLLPSEKSSSGDPNTIADVSFPCPSFCPPKGDF